MPFLTTDGARVHYLDAGSGDPPVILLHAFPFPAAMWEGQIEALSSRWRVVAPDMPGFGQSEPFGDPAVASMEAMARLVARVGEELDLPPAVVGGLSMGGYVSFAYLRDHAARVRGLVLADTRAGADTAEVRERRTKQQEDVRQSGTASLIETQVENLLSEHTHQHRPDIVERVRDLMQQASPDGVVAALEAMKKRPDVSEELAAVDIPTLLVVGENDKTSPVEVMQEMQERLPNARLTVIPSAGHLSSLEAPEEFNAELLRFLEELGP
jgi:3-oxoadipate enol-lactonase